MHDECCVDVEDEEDRLEVFLRDVGGVGGMCVWV